MADVIVNMGFTSIQDMHDTLVPEYKSRVYKPLHCTIHNFELETGARIGQINPARAEKRIQNYVSLEELARVKAKLETKDEASIRFGVNKSGQGHFGERGDFCLIGGYVTRKELNLFWRSLELQGGFGYDLALITYVCGVLEVTPKKLQMFACTANVFALRGNSNEKLFPKLKAAIRGES